MSMCKRRLALAVTQSSQEAWPAFAREAGASAVLATSFLMRPRPKWRRQCRTAAAWLGARASTWEVVRPLCVPVLSLDRSVAAVVAVTGGGAALALLALVARGPWRRRWRVAGSAVATRSERREGVVAAAGVLRRAARAAGTGGRHLGCHLGGVGGSHEGR